MKLYNKFIIILLAVLICAGCSEFDDVNTDPDEASTVPSSMLATELILKIVKKGGYKDFVYDVLLAKQIVWHEGVNSEQYNLLGKKDFDNHLVLINCEEMIAKSVKETRTAYEGLAAFVRAYMLYYTSLDLGDIPYSDAGQGEKGNVKPKYDTQKQVMTYVLEDLEKAYKCFTDANEIFNGTIFEGDPIYKGNRENWLKVVTAFQLKVLINLSKKESETDLNIKTRFADVVSKGMLMQSNADNFQLTYEDKAGMQYPLNDLTTNQSKYAMHSSVIVDSLIKYNDYRLFHYAEPASAKIKEGLSGDQYEAYMGVNPAASFGEVSSANGDGTGSILNLRYTSKDNAKGEPLIRIGYGEQQLILAEACLRKWISGNAETYYKEGIKANMTFVRNNTPEKFAHERVMNDAYINNYLDGENIQLTGNFEYDLNKIITQKYIASFFQYPYEAYYDYRRTGYPVLPIDPNTSLNSTGRDKIPVRYMYSDNEYSYNRENLKEALDRQFEGNDDINDLMWILK